MERVFVRAPQCVFMMAAEVSGSSGGSSDSSSTAEEERVRRLFQTCDGDGDGYINRSETSLNFSSQEFPCRVTLVKIREAEQRDARRAPWRHTRFSLILCDSIRDKKAKQTHINVCKVSLDGSKVVRSAFAVSSEVTGNVSSSSAKVWGFVYVSEVAFSSIHSCRLMT